MANDISITNTITIRHATTIYMQTYNIISGTYSTGGIPINPQNIPNLYGAFVDNLTGSLNVNGIEIAQAKIAKVDQQNNAVYVQLFYYTTDITTNSQTLTEIANGTDISGVVLILGFLQ